MEAGEQPPVNEDFAKMDHRNDGALPIKDGDFPVRKL